MIPSPQADALDAQREQAAAALQAEAAPAASSSAASSTAAAAFPDIRAFLRPVGVMETRYVRALSSLCALTYHLDKLTVGSADCWRAAGLVHRAGSSPREGAEPGCRACRLPIGAAC